jgi:hypothetical protein
MTTPSMQNRLKAFSACGMLAPVLYIMMVVIGGVLHPDYNHISDTVSELFSPGASNKLQLDILHVCYAVITLLFGIGVLQFVRGNKYDSAIGKIGAAMIIVIGVVMITTATIFPQDAWGTTATFPGEMHKILVGVLALLSIVSTLLIGIWLNQANVFPGFGTYSFITVVIVILSGGFAVATLGTSIMGLTERMTVFAGFQWTFMLGLKIFCNAEVCIAESKG